MLTDVLMLFITVSVWTALYEGRGIVNGQSLPQMVLYILAIQASRRMTRNSLPNLMHQKISTGSIANDFIRPISIMLSSIADQLGRNVFNFIFATVPVLIIGNIFFNPEPVTFWDVVLFIF